MDKSDKKASSKETIYEALKCFERAADLMGGNDVSASRRLYKTIIPVVESFLECQRTDVEKESVERWLSMCKSKRAVLGTRKELKKIDTTKETEANPNTNNNDIESNKAKDTPTKTRFLKFEDVKINGGKDNMLTKIATGEATVYRGEFEGKNVAIKIYNHFDLEDPEDLRRYNKLVEEKELAAKFNHPNVVTTYGWTQHKDFSGFDEVLEVMELADCDLDRVIKTKELDEDKLKELFLDIIAGLEYLHNQELVHGDIKPANVLLFKQADGGYRAKLCDFGGTGKIRRMTTEICGTTVRAYSPVYAAPETFTFSEEKYIATIKGDMYSLGWVAAYMCTGEDPPGQSSEKSITDDRFQALFGITPSVDKFWRVAVKSCVVEDPKVRLSISQLKLVCNELI